MCRQLKYDKHIYICSSSFGVVLPSDLKVMSCSCSRSSLNWSIIKTFRSTGPKMLWVVKKMDGWTLKSFTKMTTMTRLKKKKKKKTTLCKMSFFTQLMVMLIVFSLWRLQLILAGQPGVLMLTTLSKLLGDNITNMKISVMFPPAVHYEWASERVRCPDCITDSIWL